MANYASASTVAIFSPRLLTAAGASRANGPTAAQVTAMLNMVESDIHSTFHAAGYSGSVSSTGSAFNQMGLIEAIGAAAMLEKAFRAGTLSPGERDKGDQLWSMYTKQRDELAKSDLVALGFSSRGGLSVKIGGVTDSHRDDVEGDADWIPGPFSFEDDL